MRLVRGTMVPMARFYAASEIARDEQAKKAEAERAEEPSVIAMPPEQPANGEMPSTPASGEPRKVRPLDDFERRVLSLAGNKLLGEAAQMLVASYPPPGDEQARVVRRADGGYEPSAAHLVSAALALRAAVSAFRTEPSAGRSAAAATPSAPMTAPAAPRARRSTASWSYVAAAERRPLVRTATASPQRRSSEGSNVMSHAYSYSRGARASSGAPRAAGSWPSSVGPAPRAPSSAPSRAAHYVSPGVYVERVDAPIAVATPHAMSRTSSRGGCGCGARRQGRPCGCGGRRAPSPPPVAAPADAPCPNPFVPSCDTRNALAQCLKVAICDFLWCFEQRVCESGKPDFKELGPTLIQCLGTFLCSAARCIPETLCPPPEGECEVPLCMPAGFATEETNG